MPTESYIQNTNKPFRWSESICTVGSLQSTTSCQENSFAHWPGTLRHIKTKAQSGYWHTPAYLPPLPALLSQPLPRQTELQNRAHPHNDKGKIKPLGRQQISRLFGLRERILDLSPETIRAKGKNTYCWGFRFRCKPEHFLRSESFYFHSCLTSVSVTLFPHLFH